MKKFFFPVLVSTILINSMPWLAAEAPSEPVTTPIKNFSPFTGKITKNKVRMRLQSTYDGQVLRELQQNDMVVVLGEIDDFYAVQPPADVRAYIFRTYVLDNVIEGNRVNVRLKPDLDAPVIAQLSSGTRVDGTVNPESNKWLEIKVPDTTRFYIAKEYVEKIGDAGLMARLQKKQQEATSLLASSDALSATEMQKPYNQINFDEVKSKYQTIIQNYSEFPETVNKAKTSLATLQEAYTTKKIAYLESQAQNSGVSSEAAKKLAAELQAQKSKIATLEKQLENTNQPQSAAQIEASAQLAQARRQMNIPINMAYWIPVEEALYTSWTNENGSNKSPSEFYDEQKKQAFQLKGIIEVYNRPVKNKPGDYMIVNPSSKLPTAFLYSTQVNLHDYIGHEVSVLVAPRSNNNFAFPAYFVLGIE